MLEACKLGQCREGETQRHTLIVSEMQDRSRRCQHRVHAWEVGITSCSRSSEKAGGRKVEAQPHVLIPVSGKRRRGGKAPAEIETEADAELC